MDKLAPDEKIFSTRSGNGTYETLFNDFDLDVNPVYNFFVEDELTNIKVTFTKTKQIIITDEKAVPEHYLRIKQEINKSLINEDVKELVASNQPLPNWVAIEETPPKLVYRFIKK